MIIPQIDCPHCGSHETINDILISDYQGANQPFTVFGAGLVWSTDSFLALCRHYTEPQLADLCSNCGSVLRLHVRNPNRNLKKAPPVENAEA